MLLDCQVIVCEVYFSYLYIGPFNLYNNYYEQSTVIGQLLIKLLKLWYLIVLPYCWACWQLHNISLKATDFHFSSECLVLCCGT